MMQLILFNAAHRRTLWFWKMAALLVFFLSVAGIIIIYLLFAPFYLEINTKNGLYRMRFHRLASVSIYAEKNTLILQTKIAGWTRQTDLPAKINILDERSPKDKKRKKIRPQKISWIKIRGVLESFKVNKCNISVDSGDMQLNGILYPLFYFLSVYSGKDIRINFVGENEIILEIKNSIARIGLAYFRS